MCIASQYDLTLTVGSMAYAERLSDQMTRNGLRIKCHLKIDTGLNRSGIRWRDNGDEIDLIERLYKLPSLLFTGTYTHLACGEGLLDWEIAHTQL